MSMLTIDGSLGEGGGQVLRTSLSLSVICQQAVRITHIRARRSKPGLKAQHLKAVDAAAAISKAQVEGAALHADEIIFRPNRIRSGRYRFEIGTAGSTSLVLQTILIPLSLASAASTVSIGGGTHVPWSPSYHYLEMQSLPWLQQIGFTANLALDRAGFYPQGGGRITTSIRPLSSIQPLSSFQPLTLNQRGKLVRIRGISAVANLPASIAERQKRQAVNRLQKIPWEGQPDLRIQLLNLPAHSKGTFVFLVAEFEGGRACFTSLGELGKPAERVADQAIDDLLQFLESGAAIDHYLADQLLLPLSLANGASTKGASTKGASVLHTSKITQHLLTNAQIIQLFLPTKITIEGELNQPGWVTIEPGDDYYHPNDPAS